MNNLKSLIEAKEKKFEKKFPYRGIIIEDDGSHYSMEDIKSFLTQSIKEAYEMGRETEFDTQVDKAETNAEVAKKAYSDGYNDCKKGMAKRWGDK